MSAARSKSATAARRGLAVAAAAAAGVMLSPVAANASATLSASAQGVWGANLGAAQSNAEAQARANLLSLASSQGYSTCINISYSDTLVYVVPSGGGDVYNSTATGQCGNMVFHASATLSASAQGVWGANLGAAQSNAEAQARANLLSLASSHGYSTCVNISYSDTLVYVVPSGGGDVYNSTATGQCGNYTFQ